MSSIVFGQGARLFDGYGYGCDRRLSLSDA